jgi:hypothetical protein
MGYVDRKLRQQLRDKLGLMRAQAVALAAAEESTLPLERWLCGRRSFFALGVSSHHRSV